MTNHLELAPEIEPPAVPTLSDGKLTGFLQKPSKIGSMHNKAQAGYQWGLVKKQTTGIVTSENVR